MAGASALEGATQGQQGSAARGRSKGAEQGGAAKGSSKGEQQGATSTPALRNEISVNSKFPQNAESSSRSRPGG